MTRTNITNLLTMTSYNEFIESINQNVTITNENIIFQHNVIICFSCAVGVMKVHYKNCIRFLLNLSLVAAIRSDSFTIWSINWQYHFILRFLNILLLNCEQHLIVCSISILYKTRTMKNQSLDTWARTI